MDYGIKCDPKRFGDEDWRGAFGDLPALAGEVRAAGAAFIELKWEEDTDPQAVLLAARQAAEAGLWASVHPYLWNLGPEAFQESTHAAGLRQVIDLAEAVSQITGHDVPLIFHAAHVHMPPHHVPYDEALRRAIVFFAWAAAESRSRPHVRIVSETQLPVWPEEPLRRRIGDTWSEVLQTVAGTPLGVCWDFGHTFLGAQYGKHAAVPPAEFLQRVRHVHAHDVIREGDRLNDHQPLGTGLAPWRENFRRLASAGYTGGILLEMDLVPFGSAAGAAAMLRQVLPEINAIFAAARPGGAASNS
jgi:sugar phosphate isomerase/epimerase